jgi:outer membrane immunogenic protein
MRLFLITCLALATAHPVNAQEGTHNWSGFYAGLHAGAGWGNGDVKTGCNDPTGLLDGTPNCSRVIALGALVSHYATDFRGAIGGGQAGYNFQSGNFVFGAETDMAWTSINGGDSASTNTISFPGGFVTGEESYVSQNLEWLGTLRGRLGYASESWLFFATGGLAYGKVETGYSLLVPFTGFSTQELRSDIEVGWTAGGGAEFAFGKWSLKGEYLYFDLGEQQVSPRTIFNGVEIPARFESRFETEGHIARIGLNYHFD